MRRLWALAWAGAACAAGAWGWVMPGGFPARHDRFWANEVFPFVAAGLALLVLGAMARRREAFARCAHAALPGFALGASVGGRVMFPVTAGFWWVLVLLAGVALALVSLQRRWAWAAFLLIGGATGAWAVSTQRAPEPTTRPLAMDLPAPFSESNSRIFVRAGGLVVVVDPRLSFISDSPDGCWTLLAPRRDSPGHPVSSVRWRKEGPVWKIDAATLLEGPIYSHLNHWCHVHVSGFERLALRFSACDGEFEVRTRGYPFGAPARFAYVDAQRRFRVVEASSAEKGPFKVLGEGTLPADATLTVTLVRDGKPACTLAFRDFAAQLSTALSPTAGWGAPQNAIEFALAPDGETADIWFTLAGTSVGRGFDSVGHAAGCYRNRITIEAR